MGGRYIRTFTCIDCGQLTTRKWQSRRPKICLECGKRRHLVAVDAAHYATEAHARACRERLAAEALRRAS